MFTFSDQHTWQGNSSVQQILVFSNKEMQIQFEEEMEKRFKNSLNAYSDTTKKDFLIQNPMIIKNELSDTDAGAIYKLRAIKNVNANWIPCIRSGVTGYLVWEGDPLVTIEGAMFACKQYLEDMQIKRIN